MGARAPPPTPSHCSCIEHDLKLALALLRNRHRLRSRAKPDERNHVAGVGCHRQGRTKTELRSLTNGLPSRTNVCTRRKRTCGPQGGSPGLTPSPTLPRGLTGLVKLKNKKTRSRLHKNSVKNSASHRIAVPILQFNHIFVRTRDFSGPSARAQTVGSSQH